MDSVRTDHADLIRDLSKLIETVGMEHLSDFFFDNVDETKGGVASRAANQLATTAEQLTAIDEVERWISENVADAGIEPNVVCLIWGYGAEQAKRDIEVALSRESPKS